MNFKERMGEGNAFKIAGDGISYNSNEDITIMSSFARDVNAEKILRRILAGNKNVVLLSPKEVDGNLLCFYIRRFISKSESVEVIQNVKDNIEYVSASKVIIPSPSVRDIVKLFELIMYDYKSFIWTMNVKTYSRILETLETLILLNSQNLTLQNAKHLLGESDCCLVFFEADNNGLYYISNIGLAEYDINNAVVLKTLYSKTKKDRETENLSDGFVTQEDTEFIPLEKSGNESFRQINDALNNELIDEAVQSLKLKENPNNDSFCTPAEKSSEDNSIEILGEISNNGTDELTGNQGEISPAVDNIADEVAGNIEVETEKKIEVKVNKYKQLKEKIKNKKS